MRMQVRALGSALALLWALSLPVHGQQFGPFDYYDPPPGAVSIVERHHMGPIIERQRRAGQWCDYWGSLDYTLRAFPNHPEALVLMAEYLERHPACPKPPASKGSAVDLMAEIERGAWRERNADYYFQHAIEFRPEYAATRVLYGKHLYKQRRNEEAQSQFEAALKLKTDAWEAHYFLGLLYLDAGSLEKAAAHAQQAYRLGTPEPELRERLIKAGAWSSQSPR